MDLSLLGRIAASVVVGYLLGGISWALIVGKGFYKVDVREHGSGNLGATNVMRVLGWKAAAAVFVLDMAKGAVAVVLAGLLVPATMGAYAHQWTMILATLAAMAGHSFSPYLRFRGGKGVATAAGALLVIVPLVWPVLLISWIVMIAIWRMVSLGSVVIAVEFPVLVFFAYRGDWLLLGFAIVAGGLVVVRHSSNIARIVRGEEPRISLKRPSV